MDDGWYSRGYLPHFDDPERIQFITFRLHDSMPREVLELYRAQLEQGLITEQQRLKKMEDYLDKGYGACWLKQPRIGRLVENALLHGDGDRYLLISWCVMPNHVHALIEPLDGRKLRGILHTWKSYTAQIANSWLGRKGAFWQREFRDRYIRNFKHFEGVKAYIEQNPVDAGLVEQAIDWPFSSARLREGRED
ncbi:MAG: transposase [Candidatus Hydrogenedentes bacterium]|nr:transposase [Candidatus Hydrogenedentota bacterium]